jgi:RNA polymerase sigma-70 factor (ECF subfamily)
MAQAARRLHRLRLRHRGESRTFARTARPTGVTSTGRRLGLTGELDEALVVRSRRGDRAAFEELVRRTARLLFAHLYLKTSDSHKTEDLVQETLLVAWRQIADLEDPKTFRAWLMTIANSVMIDAARRASRKKRKSGAQASEDELLRAADPRPTPADSALAADERSRVMRLLQNLPQEYRDPLLLRYVGGADYQTIGRQLALSNGSLRGLLQRGMKMLREKMLEKEEKDEGREHRTSNIEH